MHPVDAFSRFGFFAFFHKRLVFQSQVCQKQLFEGFFGDFAIRASFFALQNCDLQGRSRNSKIGNETMVPKFPKRNLKLIPVAEIFEFFLQNIRKKAGFSIDIGFWI